MRILFWEFRYRCFGYVKCFVIFSRISGNVVFIFFGFLILSRRICLEEVGRIWNVGCKGVWET